MFYPLLFLSLSFLAIAFIVNENNAKFLLSGYNTMSAEEKGNVDIKSYIPYFRKFHIFLGLSLFVIGFALFYWVDKNAGGIFLVVYPIIAYIYFIWRSLKYSNGQHSRWNKVGIFVLAGVLIFVVGLLALEFKEDKLIFSSENIELKGSYGEEIAPLEIKSVELVDKLPKIILKTNGFSLGTVKKGYYQTSEGETIKLILNTDNRPIILLNKINGDKIYYSSKEKRNEEVYKEMKNWYPNIKYNQ